MLNIGFREDLETILGYSKGTAQTVMFSATIPKAIRNIMDRWMNKPEKITIEGPAQTAEGIEQYVIEIRDSMRSEAIARRSEEHTSELQSRGHLVCRLLLEKKKKYKHTQNKHTV